MKVARSRTIAGALLALSALLPLAGSVPAHADGYIGCKKSEAVSGGPTLLRLPGTRTLKLLGHQIVLIGGTFILAPNTPACNEGVFTCPANHYCQIAAGTFNQKFEPVWGHATSSSGAAGVEVSIETRVTGSGAYAWDPIQKFSCHVGGALAKDQSCDAIDSSYVRIHGGYDGRVICSWKDSFYAVAKNPSVDCSASWGTFEGGGN